MRNAAINILRDLCPLQQLLTARTFEITPLVFTLSNVLESVVASAKVLST